MKSSSWIIKMNGPYFRDDGSTYARVRLTWVGYYYLLVRDVLAIVKSKISEVFHGIFKNK